ncbi:MAG: endo-1,4-beta-xylanase [Bryobacterales bacterium]|nr:endo-1,4-beta-xylanase [Bryobacterales bacterium]
MVNEATDVKDGVAGGYRKTPWLELLGPEYIDFAFQAAQGRRTRRRGWSTTTMVSTMPKRIGGQTQALCCACCGDARAEGAAGWGWGRRRIWTWSAGSSSARGAARSWARWRRWG